MAARKLSAQKAINPIEGYDSIVSELSDLIESARRVSARSVNAVMTATYWEIGQRIVESEQRGKKRAGYGEALLERLAADLTAKFGRGFGARNLWLMRRLLPTLVYAATPRRCICERRSSWSLDPTEVKLKSTRRSTLRLAVVAFPAPIRYFVQSL